MNEERWDYIASMLYSYLEKEDADKILKEIKGCVKKEGGKMKKRILCPKCEGNGSHEVLFSGEMFLVTAGIPMIRKSVECKVCEGKGYLEEDCKLDKIR
jgi:tetrahydromethanopterin S-methyltransferase subunit A